MPLLKELSRTSRDSFGLDSDSKESWDDWLNSFKSGVLYFFDSIDSIFISIRSMLRPSVVVDRLGDGKPDMNCITDCVMGAGKCKRNCNGDKQCVKSCDDEENRCMFPKCLSSSMLQLQETSDQGGLRSIRSIQIVFDM